ncbi:RHS repeat domain-containing protein [Marinomonas sp.]|uniref:RHS repeat domain-containing protein n=1 Tax=Marinomonas sp. TaxID=1904862 RepID=UPI003BAD1AF4
MLIGETLLDGSTTRYGHGISGRVIYEQSSVSGVTEYQWDKADRLIYLKRANGTSQSYEYDELGLLSKWQLPDANVLEYQRAKGGVLRAINLNDTVLTQHHFQKGLEVMRNQGEVKSHFHYDDQGRLVNQSQMVQGREKQRRQYAYDGAGNLTHIADKQRGDTFYDYDPLSRLTAVRGNLDERFTHDATGNLIPNRINLRNSELFDHAPGNQLKLHGDSHYEYDEFGRMVKESRGKNQSLVTHYEYDCLHRLINVTMSDGSQAHYRYDAFGRRIEKRVTDKTGVETTTEFLWQGDNLIAEMTNSEQYQSYVYEPGTFRPLALLKGEGKEAEVYHYHLDQIGTPLDITTPQGETVWSVQYRAYGNVFRKIVAEIDSPLRFQGQYFDTETGLHYNRHRYYNPNAGRFITIDPIGLAGGLNNYQYVPNPTGWVDPLGLNNVPGKMPCKDSSNSVTADPEVPQNQNIALSEPETPKVKFRALTESQAKDALEGKDIQPKDINADYSIQEHIDDGKLDTQYISLGSKKAANRYARPNPKRGKFSQSVIIEVDTSKIKLSSVHDVSKGIDPSTGKALRDPGYRYSRKDKEVLIEGAIPSDAYKVVE